MSNSDNPKIGRDFEALVTKWFVKKYNKDFSNNFSFDIGNPPKSHRFDVVSIDKTIVAECKCYTWTETGNIPSAKMGFANEAAFYLSFIKDATTYIIFKKNTHPKRSETLAEYYYRTNKHLLGDTKILEYNVDNNCMKDICDNYIL